MNEDSMCQYERQPPNSIKPIVRTADDNEVFGNEENPQLSNAESSES